MPGLLYRAIGDIKTKNRKRLDRQHVVLTVIFNDTITYRNPPQNQTPAACPVCVLSLYE